MGMDAETSVSCKSRLLDLLRKAEEIPIDTLENFVESLKLELKDDPYKPDTCYCLGLAYHLLGDSEGAKAHVADAIIAKPTYVNELVNLAETYHAKGKAAEAARLLVLVPERFKSEPSIANPQVNIADLTVKYAIEALDEVREPRQEANALGFLERVSKDYHVSHETRRMADHDAERYRRPLDIDATQQVRESLAFGICAKTLIAAYLRISSQGSVPTHSQSSTR